MLFNPDLSISRDELDSGMRLLMECAFRPVITTETVADGLNNIENDLMYLKYDQCREKEVLELACQAAYRGNTLGLPRLMPEEILEKSKNKEGFVKTYHKFSLHLKVLTVDLALIFMGMRE